MTEKKKGWPRRLFERAGRAALDLGTVLIVLKMIGVEPLASQWQWWQVASPWLLVGSLLLLCALVVGFAEIVKPMETK